MQIEPQFPRCRFVPVSMEVALDSDRKALAGIALRAFESAHIITRRGRFDLGQPHGVPAFGACEDSDFSTAVEWIWMGGWHDARLRSGGRAILSVTGNCRQEPGDRPSVIFQGSESLVNSAHSHRFEAYTN